MSSTRDKVKQELLSIARQFSKFSEAGGLSDVRIVPPKTPGEDQSYVVDLVGPLTAEQKAKLPTESHGYEVRYNIV
jgi:hypothetical protein